MSTIILASQSPRRKQLMELAGIDFEIKVANTAELIDKNWPLNLVAENIALEKAIKIEEDYKNKCVIAADTIVLVNDNEILGKPNDKPSAIEMLKKLSGKRHSVITGVVIIYNGQEIKFSDTTLVKFNELTDQEIEYYIDSQKPFDKAGAYAIQEWIGAVGIASIEGDFYNVMGLPINKIYSILKNLELLSLQK